MVVVTWLHEADLDPTTQPEIGSAIGVVLEAGTDWIRVTWPGPRRAVHRVGDVVRVEERHGPA